MKVIFAILVIVGLAVALPSPKSIVKNLKEQLQQDVQDIKTHTKELQQLVSAHAKQAKEALIKNPITALRVIVQNLANDAQVVTSTTVSDVKKVSDHVQTAINELSQVDAGPMKEIMSNLKQQLVGDVKGAKSAIHELVKQTIAHAKEDVKAVMTNPSGAAKTIQDNWNIDFNAFINGSQNFVSTVQQQIQEALDKMNKEIDQ